MDLLLRRWICAVAKSRQDETMKPIGSMALRAGLPASILTLRLGGWFGRCPIPL
jgi:hypothetical protein